MNWLKELWRRLLYLRRRDELDADLKEEMRLHLELSAESGNANARKTFGNMTRLREEAREAWGWGWLDSLGQDLKYGWRNLMASRGFTMTAILSLALGIGANTAVFSIINAVMLRSLPVSDPHRLVKFEKGGTDTVTNPLWEAIRDHQNACAGTLAYSAFKFDLSQEGEKQLVNGLWVSGDFFNVLQVPAARGRVFTKEDDQRGGGKYGPVAVISHAFWQNHFASDSAIIGKTIKLNGLDFQIIGVTPASFTGLDVERAFSVAVPIGCEPLFQPDQSTLDFRSYWWLNVVGRLQPGVSMEQANERLKTVSGEIMRLTMPQDWDDKGKENYAQGGLSVKSVANGFSGIRQNQRTTLFAMMGVVAMVLLIACANIANLLLARAAARQQEISVRMAIGAARRRLVRQLLTESLLLAALGIPFGLLLARWGSEVLIRAVSSNRNPLQIDASLDQRVLLFTVGMTLLTGLFFGLAPALRATRVSTNELLKQSTRGARQGGFKLGRALVAGQVALSLALLVGAGLFVATLRNLMNVPLGFNEESILMVDVDLRGKVQKEQRAARFETILERLQTTPGLSGAAMTFITPISGGGWNGFLYPEGEPHPTDERPSNMSWFNRVSPAFFETMQAPLIMGRTFDARDTLSATKVIILGQKTARDFFGEASPIGKRVMMEAGPGGPKPFEVIGVAQDTKYLRVTEDLQRTAFVAVSQDPEPSERTTFLVRAGGTIQAASAGIRAALAQASPGASLEIHRLDQQVRDSMNTQRTAAGLFAFFGALALLLAVIGLYGVTSYAVAQRQGEIGIRLALGAQRGSVMWLVLRDVAIILAVGTAVGITMSVGAGRLISGLMFGIETGDFRTMGTAAAALLAAGGVAGLLPAMRASKLDPMRALRCE